MKRTTIFLFLFTFSLSIQAQTLRVTSVESGIEGLSANISDGNVTVLETNGSELVKGKYNSLTGDPSVASYVFPNGSFIVRENIANFLLYDSFGRVQKSISNSTQSEGGEAISELASDQFGKTIVLYNPKVMMNGATGSRAKIINSLNVPLDVYYSQDRELSIVNVSANGEFIAFGSIKSGTEDEIQLMDRFGNILTTIEFDQPVKGVSFSENGLFVTIFSGGRAAAYEVRSGERVGSTSFRNTSVIFAGYDPVDKIIICLTGNGSSTISDIQLHTVNVAARKIAREDYNGSLEIKGQLKIERTGSSRYTLTGLDKKLDLRASF